MFKSQNKEVTTKFQNGRSSFSSQAIPPRTTSTATCKAKCAKITARVRLQPSPNQSNAKKVEPKSTQHSPKPDQQNTQKLLNKSPPSTGRNVQLNSKLGCSASNGRKGTATVNKHSRPFVSTTRVFRPSSSKIFDYDLSREEKRHFVDCRNPMKSVPNDELQLLRNGHRVTYLETRYDRSPDKRYNYPEATSWRYGWFHRTGV
ncbi:uncharacterized protein LOC133840337 [Drosophila sulfurigaster albostrigata]|uniref:uncharacterized protein LOC133840337 n=1 Tax=Drosophila sulfurigaster albostrigata TaxID=89887 RepID=UPI002D21E06E|nr:uncharacterized protein LOC133840337 [Drosophila sulfurigaster albostrigata]